MTKDEVSLGSLKWRLPQLPTVDQVSKLIESGVITKEEARSIFFKVGEEVENDSLQEIRDELSVIRTLVTKLPITVYQPMVIRDMNKYFDTSPNITWQLPYKILCSTVNSYN
jgi:hypothetical protein